ncbi:phage major capsid protein [Mycolicibacterium smegmatis]|uniref:phage major capsid protein n=1 Tax=Mycolicibacterium smegmatis TaxID=1772 RepID=UPI001EFB15C7|nr:phage major capsid protein [Mycolicibacterium smegmatis]ULN34185.1 phage major capsid protein [Mycolicibacterium smegmatis]
MTNLTTPSSAKAFAPDVTTFEANTVLQQAAILQHSTVSAQIEGDAPAVRVGYVKDDDAEFVDEGDEIPEGDPQLAEALVFTKKFAVLDKLSREQYRQAQSPEQLAASITRSMTFKADTAFLAQPAPTAPATAPVAGMMNVAGLVTKSGVADNLDDLIDLEAEVRANLGFPTSWILAPDTWAELRKLKKFTGGTDSAASNEGILGAGTENAQPLLLGIPVDVRPKMPSGAGLLVDRTQIISAVAGLELAVDPSYFFGSDNYAIRAVWRTGHTVVRPERIGRFTMA